MKLTFLGTRGEIALRSKWHRRHSAMLVSSGRTRIMIDCGLDWLGKLRTIRPHAILLTHAHADHADGLRLGASCIVWASPECWHSINRFPIVQRGIVEPRTPFVIGGVRFEAFPVEHSLIAPAVGYRFDNADQSYFYVPDVVRIPAISDALRGVSLYIGDGARLMRSLVRRSSGHEIGHTAITTQLNWCVRYGVPRALFTHCGSEIVRAPHARTRARIRDLAEHSGIRADVAFDGLQLAFSHRHS